MAEPAANETFPVAAVSPARIDGHVSDRVVDFRFRSLVGEDGWARLPDAVQRRFSKRLAPGVVQVYVGEVVETRLSRLGRMLAFFARFVGGPLPLDNGMTGGATVAVMENPGLGGQSWTRTYARSGRFPQVIHSAKCFAGPTGLEEHVGYGIGMSLAVAEEQGALVFRSVRYFLAIGNARLPIPRLIEPGMIEVVHRDEGAGSFRFTLRLSHRWFGELIFQDARFCDV